jgi:hypothetical protein
MFKKVARKKMFRAKGRKGTTTKKFKRKAGPSLRAIAAKVSKLTKTIETKSGVQTINDNIGFRHNKFCQILAGWIRRLVPEKCCVNAVDSRVSILGAFE